VTPVLTQIPRFLLLTIFVAFSACSGVEDKRLRELMVERGFGSRADGNATFVNYVTGGDAIVFELDPTLAASPAAQSLFLLSQPQGVGIDGTIYIPLVGPVYVLGKTEREVTALVRGRLGAIFKFEPILDARIINAGKRFFAFGEVGQKGAVPMTRADLTILDAISGLRWTRLANLGRVRVVYPDAQHPLVVTVNIREMVETGYTTMNVPIYNNTIIYVPPTLLGGIARFLQRILEPLRAAVGALLGLAQIRTSYDVVTGDARGGQLFFRF